MRCIRARRENVASDILFKSGLIEVSMMLEILKTKVLEHRNLHPGLEWSEVEHRLRRAPAAIAVFAKDGGKRR